MKYQGLFLLIIVMIASSFVCDFYASAENITRAVNSSNTLSGKITNIQGEAISNAIITISAARDNTETSRKTISAKDGSFELYIPILGFVGALLYVLDLCRRGREDIPRGTEFGMRLIMGPYVAIVMVLLFANNLGFVDFTSPLARATLAFFSGLLVVVAHQGLIERGNETLGRWRRNSRYMP